MGCGAVQRPSTQVSRLYIEPGSPPEKASASTQAARPANPPHHHRDQRHVHQSDAATGSSREENAAQELPTPAADSLAMARVLRSSGLQACRRLGAELEEMSRQAGHERSASSSSSSSGVPHNAGPRSSDTLLEWDAWLLGPGGSPYDGGVFRLALWFPEDYPFKPPRVQFVTPCYHPNISIRGQVCLNVLKEEWSPMLTVASLLTCISGLLCEPNAEDPLNNEAADMLQRHPQQFWHTAQSWTRRYAMKGGGAGAGERGPSSGSQHGQRRLRQGADPSDLASDPLATYQTVGGHTMSEEEAVREAMHASRVVAPAATLHRR